MVPGVRPYSVSGTGSVRGLRRLPGSRRRAVIEALFVTFLWSTSYLLIDPGLADIPALVLVPLVVRREQHAAIARLDRRDWGRLLALGVTVVSMGIGETLLLAEHEANDRIGRRKFVSLTEAGTNTLRAFRYLL